MNQLSSFIQSAVQANVQHEYDIVALHNLTEFDYQKCREMLAAKPLDYWKFVLNTSPLGNDTVSRLVERFSK